MYAVTARSDSNMTVWSWTHISRTYAKPLRSLLFIFLVMSLVYSLRVWSARRTTPRVQEYIDYEGSADYASASGSGEENDRNYETSYSTFESYEDYYDNKVVPILYNVSRCEDCFPKHELTLAPHKLCDDDVQTASGIEALILILSRPDSVGRRQAIRETWLLKQPLRLRHVFVIEDTDDKNLQAYLAKEQQQSNDIVQFNCMASEHVLPTVKTVLALRWASQECDKARTVLKSRDDVYINLKRLLELTATMEPGPQMLGECSMNSKAHEQLGYCTNPVYSLSRSAVSAIVNVSPDVPPVKSDALYIGMCLNVAGASIFRNVPRWSWAVKPEMTQEVVCSNVTRSLAIPNTSPKTARELWDTCKDYKDN